MGALICTAAIWAQSFWLLCFGTLVFGVYNAYGQYYRFAAADVASRDFKATAISLVLAGGLVGGILGPTTSRFTIGLLAPKFMGAYLVLIGFAVATMILLRFIRIRRQAQPSARRPGARCGDRRAAEIRDRGRGGRDRLRGDELPDDLDSDRDAGLRPSVRRRRVRHLLAHHRHVRAVVLHRADDPARRRAAGDVRRRAAQLRRHRHRSAGIAVANFWWSLVILGVGWNFLYIGGTTLLTQTYRPEERARAQGTERAGDLHHDGDLFAYLRLTVTTAGWERVNLFALPLVAAVAIAIAWFALRERPQGGRGMSQPAPAAVGAARGRRYPALLLDLAPSRRIQRRCSIW